MPKSKTKIKWRSIQIPSDLNKEMVKLVETGRFISKNEIARNAIRWYLDALKKGEVP